MTTPAPPLRIAFMGRKPAGAAVLRWTLAQPVRVVAVLAESDAAYAPVRAEAHRAHLPVFSQDAAAEAVASGALAFDLGVSFVYDRRVRPPLLTHPPLGILNFHPAPLPDFRGMGGYNLAILDGHTRWAVSAHYMDAEIDTGPIVAVRTFGIDPDAETVHSLEQSSLKHLRALYRTTFRRVLRHGHLPTRPNVGGRTLTRAGLDGLKPIRPGDDVARKVRAFWFPPHTGASIEVDGQRYTLVSDELLHALAVGAGRPRRT